MSNRTSRHNYDDVEITFNIDASVTSKTYDRLVDVMAGSAPIIRDAVRDLPTLAAKDAYGNTVTLARIDKSYFVPGHTLKVAVSVKVRRVVDFYELNSYVDAVLAASTELVKVMTERDTFDASFMAAVYELTKNFSLEEMSTDPLGRVARDAIIGWGYAHQKNHGVHKHHGSAVPGSIRQGATSLAERDFPGHHFTRYGDNNPG